MLQDYQTQLPCLSGLVGVEAEECQCACDDSKEAHRRYDCREYLFPQKYFNHIADNCRD
jgi:hypothetical protein